LLLSVSATLAQDGAGRLTAGGVRDVRAGGDRPITDFRDASFEDPGAGAWSMSSDSFGTPLCNAGCGDGGGTSGPQTGSYWLWFGGISGNEFAYAEQVVVLPQTLDLYMSFSARVGAFESGDDAVLNVIVDGFSVYNLTASGNSAYTYIYIDLRPYADGEAHTIRFEYSQIASTTVVNLSVDDIALDTGSNQLTDGDFETGFGWSEINVSGDMRKCDTLTKFYSYVGSCAYVFTGGTSGIAKIRQVLLSPRRALPEFGLRAPTHTLIYAGAFIKTTGAGKGKLILKVTLSDGAVLKKKVTLQSLGAYDWQQTEFIAFSNEVYATKISTTYQVTSLSGTLRIDEAETILQGYYGIR
jgi:hypothetical protein